VATVVMQVLLNWLWQGITLPVVVGLVVRMRGRALNAATRERIWWMTLLGVLAIPVVHLLTLVGDAPVEVPLGAPDLTNGQRLVVTVPTFGPMCVGLLWAAWMVVSAIRVAWGGLQLRMARRLALPVGEETERRLKTWNEIRSQGRSTSLVTSRHVRRAAVLGLGKPLIALAPEILAGLTDGELDQVVVHEYAHVQRRDDLAVFLQSAIRVVAGLHPAVWWLDRALATEREVACDDWVLAHTGSAKRYATCLLGLASTGDRSWSLSPLAVLSKSQLSVRVARMFDHGRNQTLVRSRAALLVARPAMVALVVAAGAFPLVEIERDGYRATEPGAVVDLPLSAGETRPMLPVLGESTRNQSAAFIEAGPPTGIAWQPPKGEGLPGNPAPPGSPMPLIVGSQGFALDDLSVMPENLPTRQPEAGKVAPVLLATSWSSMASAPLDPPEPAVRVDDEWGADILEATPSRWDVTWRPAAIAGAAIGAGSRKAAVRTAGFFGQLGKTIAGSF
jgi:beta-lactamase regulating signal transducer with metallopeptidase domain